MTDPIGPNVVVGTGHKYLVQTDSYGNRIPPFDARTGDHLWLLTASFRIADPAVAVSGDDGPAVMDMENLLSVLGPYCWYCEQAYAPRLLKRRCKGRP